MFKLFEFKEGKLKVLPALSKKSIKDFFIISIIVIVITSLAGWLKFEEKDLWKIYNLLIARFNLQQELPDIRDHEKQLDARIELEVDKAIRDYERLTGDDGRVRISPPRYSEKPIDPKLQTGESRLLGGEMRLCAPWVLDCPKEDVVE